MPRKPNANEAKDTKWNMYINEQEKLQYVLELAKIGKSRYQGAGIRALMHLYVNDPVVREKTNAIIDDFAVYKQNGDISHL